MSGKAHASVCTTCSSTRWRATGGLAQALCAELLRRAHAEGARSAYLQVDADNGPGLAAYRQLGFVEGYGYHYRSPDARTA